MQTGVQILTGFLLTLPSQQRFITLVAGAAALTVLVGLWWGSQPLAAGV